VRRVNTEAHFLKDERYQYINFLMIKIIVIWKMEAGECIFNY
jgi:hypothetical protein